jgi:uncharacterized protein YwgA
MKTRQRDAVLLDLIRALEVNDSWSGETHVQKSTYFLQALTGVPLGFDFSLYKYGPYAFDLSDTLSSLRADHLIELQVRKPGYGGSIVETPYGDKLRSRFPRTVQTHRSAVEIVAERVGTKDVASLERVATALLVSSQDGWQSEQRLRAQALCEIKPHVTAEDALAAVAFVDDLRQEWASRATT